MSKDDPVKCCEPTCCCEKPSKLDNFKYWRKHKKNIWFEMKKSKFNYFIVKHIIVPFLNHMINENHFVKYFDREWEIAKWTNEDKKQEMRSIVSLVSLFNKCGYMGLY